MKELDEYFAAERRVHQYFGFEGAWHVYPLDDKRNCFWRLEGDQILFDYDEECLTDPNYEMQYSDSILSPEGNPGVYRKDKYTMIVVDTECDGNRFLAIFDNSKEVKHDCKVS